MLKGGTMPANNKTLNELSNALGSADPKVEDSFRNVGARMEILQPIQKRINADEYILDQSLPGRIKGNINKLSDKLKKNVVEKLIRTGEISNEFMNKLFDTPKEKKLTLRELDRLQKIPAEKKYNFAGDLQVAEFLFNNNDKEGLKKLSNWILDRPKGIALLPHAFYLRLAKNLKRFSETEPTPGRLKDLKDEIIQDIKFLKETDLGRNDPAFK
jgi:hypothetical protein